MRSLVWLALAGLCGLAALLLPEGVPAGLASFGMIAFGLVGAGNFIVALRRERV